MHRSEGVTSRSRDGPRWCLQHAFTSTLCRWMIALYCPLAINTSNLPQLGAYELIHFYQLTRVLFSLGLPRDEADQRSSTPQAQGQCHCKPRAASKIRAALPRAMEPLPIVTPPARHEWRWRNPPAGSRIFHHRHRVLFPFHLTFTRKGLGQSARDHRYLGHGPLQRTCNGTSCVADHAVVG
ncbi:uncharacterized protein BO80DRAFT_206205 [Aspergillus ibericus CBS 121593]|uniref:Uncharacterized protein n=1 Tax=Aspergillus ibericus CBS 121593 TaxID=1448316 RepID=A0A395HEM1_9EURO|nr:hypothetical protein BO80DRAFT_206205 [Aspergillus ibericus CBS 121593]RAL04684.1 hypothetical protein BO80DRAFT_206205 [Aspergillus ibericus CBS 121593]